MRALYAQAYNDVFYLVKNSGEAIVWRKIAVRLGRFSQKKSISLL